MDLIPFRATYPATKLIPSPESFFGTVKHNYPDYKKGGFFKKKGKEAIYVYKITTSLGSYDAIISCVDIHDYINKNVLVHEHTLASKEQRMMGVVLQNKAMVKPILLAYESNTKLESYIAEQQKKKPFLDIPFPEANEHHIVWEVTDKKSLATLQALFKSTVPKSYIADGHHRTATAVSLYKNNDHLFSKESLREVLSIFISFKQLQIFDYNRILDILHEIDPIEFVAILSKYCKITPLSKGEKPTQKHDMTMLLRRKWYRLTWRKRVLKKYANEEVVLDADLLNRYIFTQICDIQNIREDNRIKYIEGVAGIQGLATEVNKSENRLGFCLYPVSKEELRSVADHEDTLPPKSTWFEPRIKNGLIVKDF